MKSEEFSSHKNIKIPKNKIKNFLCDAINNFLYFFTVILLLLVYHIIYIFKYFYIFLISFITLDYIIYYALHKKVVGVK